MTYTLPAELLEMQQPVNKETDKKMNIPKLYGAFFWLIYIVTFGLIKPYARFENSATGEALEVGPGTRGN